MTHLRESTVVPDVTVMGKAVADKAQTTFLGILLDRIEGLFLADFHFGVGPTRYFNNHVEVPIVLIGEKRNVVEGRENRSILFNVHSVI